MLSGVLNIAIKELEEWINDDGVMKNDAVFANNMAIEDVMDMYEKLSSPLAGFVADCCIQIDSENFNNFLVPKNEVFTAFITYCLDRKLPTLSEAQFYRKFKVKCRWVADSTCLVGGVQQRAWRGLKLDENNIKLEKTIHQSSL